MNSPRQYKSRYLKTQQLYLQYRYNSSHLLKIKSEADYRPLELVHYFAKKTNTIENSHNSTANHLIQICQDNIKEQITFGLTIIPDLGKSLEDYMHRSPHKQQQQGLQLKKSRKINLSPPPNHQQFIERMSAIRHINENKRKQYLQYEQRKKQQMFQKQQEERLKSQEQKRSEKEQKIKQKLQELQRRKIKSIQEQKESIRRYKSVINEKRRHELMAEKYENNVIRLAEEERKKLQQRSQRIKGYSIEQIREFQREYVRKQQERLQSEPKKQKWEYTPPPIHPRLAQILEQQKIQERVKLQQKKRALQQKISRQSDYVQYLKESISIKIDEKKKKEMQQLTAIKPIIKKSDEQVRNIGNSYLKDLRSKIKKHNKKDNYSLKEESRKAESHSGQKMKSNTSMGHYQESISRIRENRINRLISASTIEKQEKLQKLKLEVLKLNEQAKRKEQMSRVATKRKDSDSHLDVLINSIKAKVGIMNLYRD